MEIVSALIFLYALLMFAGGVMAYATARSKPSLISGAVSGIALAIAGLITLQNLRPGLILAILFAIFLLIVFVLRAVKTNKFMPAGLLAVLSLIATILFGYFLATLPPQATPVSVISLSQLTTLG